jgi:ADP-ribosylglycohydrolase
MNASSITQHERILGGLFGCAVGDALGVPVEFRDRASVQNNPVSTLRGHGTHGQPPGTWSDDTSLMLCLADSLRHHAFDTATHHRITLDLAAGPVAESLLPRRRTGARSAAVGTLTS